MQHQINFSLKSLFRCFGNAAEMITLVKFSDENSVSISQKNLIFQASQKILNIPQIYENDGSHQLNENIN